MPVAYTRQLAGLADTVGQMAALAGSAMDEATRALLDADLFRAEEVISGYEAMAELSAHAEEEVFALLVLQSPVAGDLRQVIAALKIVFDVERMGALARHIADIARRRHPVHALPAELRPQFADMGRIAVDLAAAAREVLDTGDQHRAARLGDEDEAMDRLHRHLFGVLQDRCWPHGVETAVDVTLLSRYYERFADHAVEVGRHLVFLVTGAALERDRKLRT